MDASFWATQRVLVTGAAGFLGRWTARTLATSRAELILVDKVPTLPETLFVERPGRDAAWFTLDLTDTAGLTRLLADTAPTVVINLVGSPGEVQAHDNPAAAFNDDALATRSLLDALYRYNDAEPARLAAAVHVSTSAVYGMQAQTPTPESAPLNARAVGAAGQACADILARAYADSFGLPLSVARVARTFGGDDRNEHNLVSDCISRALDGEPPLIRGSGLDAAGYLHVDDAVNAILKLAERTEADPDIAASAFNIAPAEPITVLELARRVLRRAGRPDIDPIVSMPGDGATTEHLDTTAARKLLGWTPAMTLDEGIEEALTWYAARSLAA